MKWFGRSLCFIASTVVVTVTMTLSWLFVFPALAEVLSANYEHNCSHTAVASIQQRRRRLLLDECHTLRMTNVSQHNSPRPPWHVMTFDDQLQYIYCIVGKTSATNWKATLMMLTGKLAKFERPEQMPFGLVHKYERSGKYARRLGSLRPAPRDRRLSSYFTFLFVREPLERLVSAYRDKLLVDPRYHVDVDIVKQYRPQDYNKTVKRYNVTFAEFVRYVLDQHVAGRRLDRHWLPQNELCQPCHIRYDFIGHFETLHQDADFVVTKLKSRIQNARQRRTVAAVTFPTDSGHRKSSEFVQEMYATVPAEHVQALYRLYAVDYALFGLERHNVTGFV